MTEPSDKNTTGDQQPEENSAPASPEKNDDMQGAHYEVRLENYYGPLDLLLYLIRQHEVDIFSIPIAEITGQYIRYLDEVQKLNVKVASEFTVMASTLMRIKSRSLVPEPEREPEEEEMEDPRKELIENLVRYRQFKERARKLRERKRERDAKWAAPDRSQPYRTVKKPSPSEVNMELWPLIRTYHRVKKETELSSTPSRIIYDEIPQQVLRSRIMEKIEDRDDIPFEEILGKHPTRYRTISYFLALLDLAKDGEIQIEQEATGDGEITIRPGKDSDN